MKILRPKAEEAQSSLDLQFENWPICRNSQLLEMMKIKGITMDDATFPFDQINLPARPSFQNIMLYNQDIQINVGVAHERLMTTANAGIHMPLCIWSIDALFGHQTKNGGGPTLPERPAPGRKLIILTQGMFCQSSDINSNRYICLRETDNGFQIEPVGTNNTFLLYQNPGYDLVSLCVPREACKTSQTA